MSETASFPETDLLDLVADLVAAYVSNNSIPGSELPALIANVHAALTGLTGSAPVETISTEKLTPAQIRKSITPDGLISFEDGKAYKTLRRHLTTRGLSPETYRAKWGLSADYPMVSAAYSAQRSELARTLGLGRKRPKVSTAEVDEDVQTLEEAAPAKRRGRPPGKATVLADA